MNEGRPIPPTLSGSGPFDRARSEGKRSSSAGSFTCPNVRRRVRAPLCNDPCTISGFREPISGSSRSSRPRARESCSPEQPSERTELGVCAATGPQGRRGQGRTPELLTDAGDRSARALASGSASSERAREQAPPTRPASDDARLVRSSRVLRCCSTDRALALAESPSGVGEPPELRRAPTRSRARDATEDVAEPLRRVERSSQATVRVACRTRWTARPSVPAGPRAADRRRGVVSVTGWVLRSFAGGTTGTGTSRSPRAPEPSALPYTGRAWCGTLRIRCLTRRSISLGAGSLSNVSSS